MSDRPIPDQFENHQDKGFMHKGKDLDYIIEIENKTPRPMTVVCRHYLVDDMTMAKTETLPPVEGLVLQPGAWIPVFRGRVQASDAPNRSPHLRVEAAEVKGQGEIPPFNVVFKEIDWRSYMKIEKSFDDKHEFIDDKEVKQVGLCFLVTMRRAEDDPVTEPIAAGELRCQFSAANLEPKALSGADQGEKQWLWPGRAIEFYQPMQGVKRPLKWTPQIEGERLETKEESSAASIAFLRAGAGRHSISRASHGKLKVVPERAGGGGPDGSCPGTRRRGAAGGRDDRGGSPWIPIRARTRATRRRHTGPSTAREADAPSTREFSTSAKTEQRAETTEGRGPEGGSTLSAGRSGEDDAIPASAEGYLFNKYRMLHKLGGGGMGFVWLVEHVALEQQRALKIIRSEVADDPVNLDRFRREARILAKLSRHPNAVQVYDTGFVGKFAYIEMDYLEGQTLKNRLEQDGVMPLADVAWFLGELCAVLGEAHAPGDRPPRHQAPEHHDRPRRLHRAGRAGQGPRFRHRQDRPGRRGRHGRHDPAYRGLPGDLPYSSPEQLGLPLQGRREAAAVNHRSDIYTVGVMLYEMLVGTRPFMGIPTKIFYDHVHTPPPPFAESARAADIPADVEAVVRRCLEKDPELRPQSVHELWESFKAAAGEISFVGETTTRVREPDSRTQLPTVEEHAAVARDANHIGPVASQAGDPRHPRRLGRLPRPPLPGAPRQARGPPRRRAAPGPADAGCRRAVDRGLAQVEGVRGDLAGRRG